MKDRKNVLRLQIIWACRIYKKRNLLLSLVAKDCAFYIYVGLSANSWLLAACSANLLAVSSAVSPASKGVTRQLVRQASASIPHARIVRRLNVRGATEVLLLFIVYGTFCNESFLHWNDSSDVNRRTFHHSFITFLVTTPLSPFICTIYWPGKHCFIGILTVASLDVA